MLLGTRIEGAGTWEGPPRTAAIITIVLVIVVVAASVVVVGWVPKARFLVVFLVTFPFLYAAFPSNWFWNDGRYAIWATPILALVVVGALWRMASPVLAKVLTMLVLCAALASTLVAFNAGYGALSQPSELTKWSTNPNATIDRLIVGLENHGATDVYAGYWVAYELTYLSGGAVSVMALENDRNPVDDHVVEDAPSAGWLFVHAGRLPDLAQNVGTTQFLESNAITEAQFEDWLGAHGILYRVVELGDFDLVVPVRNVHPSVKWNSFGQPQL
jgi:hypothetical protein